MKISDRLKQKVKNWYEKNGWEFQSIDNLICNFWFKIFPYLLLLPLFFWFLKWLIIDIMYKKNGFEETILFLAVILLIKPMILEALKKILEAGFRD